MKNDKYYWIENWPMTEFGKNLASTRKERQLTQLELANLLEVQPRMIGRWEQGTAKPQFDYLVKLANVLEVSIDLLINSDKKPKENTFDIKNKKLKELCKQVDKLQQDDQDLICHFLNMAIRQDKMKRIIANH